MYRVISFFIVLLVCFHVLETDGPCDYEEHFSESISYSSPHSQVSPVPVEDHEHHGNKHIVPEHFGHTAVLLSDSFGFEVYLNSFLILHPRSSHGKIHHFISENFRPPLV